MKRFYNADMFLVILLAIISAVSISTSPLNEFPLRIIPCLLILFFLPGYALTVALYPVRENFRLIKLVLLSIILSAALTLLFASINLFRIVDIPSTIVFYLLAAFTIIIGYAAFERRKKVKWYIKCRSCNGYYQLEKGESLDDFESCTCGGELEYSGTGYKTDKKEKGKGWFKKFKKDEKKAEFKKEKSKSINESISAKKEVSMKGFRSTYMDLILVFVVTIFSIVCVVAPVLNDSFIRTLLGLFFILFLPGYALIAALFPKVHDLDGIERLALSFGLSIAVAPLIGLGLNYTPFGIRLTPILVSLSIFTVSMLFIAFLRRKRISEEDRFSVDFSGFFNSVKSSFSSENRTDKVLSIVLVASIVLAISMTGYVIASPKEGEKFTEFYILGPNGKASDYPTNLTAGEKGSVIVGVVNHEYSTINYQMVVKINNRTLSTRNITLANNEKYENTFNFTAPGGGKQKLEFLLYKLPDNATAYRSLHLWLN
jgi:uncharacterized membrane protein